jgi:hypothetical protein
MKKSRAGKTPHYGVSCGKAEKPGHGTRNTEHGTRNTEHGTRTNVPLQPWRMARHKATQGAGFGAPFGALSAPIRVAGIQAQPCDIDEHMARLCVNGDVFTTPRRAEAFEAAGGVWCAQQPCVIQHVGDTPRAVVPGVLQFLVSTPSAIGFAYDSVARPQRSFHLHRHRFGRVRHAVG